MIKGRIRNFKQQSVLKLAVYFGITSLLSVSCSQSSYEGMIVAVEMQDVHDNSYTAANLVAVNTNKPGKPAILLSKGFESASAPTLSYDGRYLFFQGKKAATDLWQIWVMDLRKKSIRQVCDLPEDCTHPTSLPDGKLIFSRAGMMGEHSSSSLWKCDRDGAELEQLTFYPGHNLHSSVVSEGRVVYLNSPSSPVTSPGRLMIMRPDGTKAELYYQSELGSSIVTGGMESDDGYLYFINQKTELVRVNHSRPLHTAEIISGNLPGSFSAVVPLEGKACLVSYQPSNGQTFGLYRFDSESRDTPNLIYRGDKDLTDPIPIWAMRERPKILPSEVNMEKTTGLLMSQDINHSRMSARSGLSGDTLARAIKVYGLDGLIGETEVNADGSFYLEVTSDAPFRIETLNSTGEVVRGPSDWIYLRPNERRACLGCHADQELAPKNLQPLAVKGPPVVLTLEEGNK